MVALVNEDVAYHLAVTFNGYSAEQADLFEVGVGVGFFGVDEEMAISQVPIIGIQDESTSFLIDPQVFMYSFQRTITQNVHVKRSGDIIIEVGCWEPIVANDAIGFFHHAFFDLFSPKVSEFGPQLPPSVQVEGDVVFSEGSRFSIVVEWNESGLDFHCADQNDQRPCDDGCDDEFLPSI